MLLNELSLFVRALEAGSFTRAAQALGVPKSTVSRAVARLEDHLQARLLERTARKVVPTEAGRLLFAQCAPHVAALLDAGRVLAALEEQPRGTLRVTAPVDAGVDYLGELVARFVQRHPEVRVEVELTNRTVDLVAEGFDIAIRGGPLKGSSLVARRLLGTAITLFASPAYLARRGTPRTPGELATHETVLFRAREGRATWSLTGPRERVEEVEVTGRVCGQDFPFIRTVLLAGAGVGGLPAFQVQRQVAAGQLVPVLPGWSLGTASISIVHASARHVPRKVTAFRDFVIENFRTQGM
ncbi:MAG TPA: LysR family transcriptional regulator [Myxococcus sp.]|nr:LysR family transcriptional regulator [Myxococcus sp.]